MTEKHTLNTAGGLLIGRMQPAELQARAKAARLAPPHSPAGRA